MQITSITCRLKIVICKNIFKKMQIKIFSTEIKRMGEKEEIESSWTELQDLGSLSSPHQKVGMYPETLKAEFKEFKPRR